MTTVKKDDGSADQGQTRYFILALRSGLDAMENTAVAAAEIPLSILSGFGVSEETTDAAREANRQLAHGIHGTVDSVATQIAEAVNSQVALVSDAVGEAAKSVSK